MIHKNYTLFILLYILGIHDVLASAKSMERRPTDISIKNLQTKVENYVFGALYKTPLLIFEREKNSYTQIIRCSEDYVDIFKNNKKKMGNKWAWFEALSHFNQCHIVSNMTLSSSYQDITTSNGNFFYLLNPCPFFSEDQNYQEKLCSFNLTVSEVIHYPKSHAKLFLEKAEELLILEEANDNNLIQLDSLITKISDVSESCASISDMDKEIFKLSLTETQHMIQHQNGIRSYLEEKAPRLHQVFTHSAMLKKELQTKITMMEPSNSCVSLIELIESLMKLNVEENLEQLSVASIKLQEFEKHFAGYTLNF